MQRVHERADGQVGRPDHRCWPDEELAGQSGEGESDHLGGKDEEELVADCELGAVEDVLRCDDFSRVGGSGRDGRHDCDEGVFLDVERAGVDEFRERPVFRVRDLCHCFSDGEGDQLNNETGNRDDGSLEDEELIDACKECRGDHAEYPRTERIDGHGRVIDIADRRANFGVNGIIL